MKRTAAALRTAMSTSAAQKTQDCTMQSGTVR